MRIGQLKATIIGAVAVLSASLPAAAHATFPGKNGMIVALFDSYRGSNYHAIFEGVEPNGHASRIYFCTEFVGNCGAGIENPSISSDGKVLAFDATIETYSYISQSQITLLRFGKFGLTLVPFTSQSEEEYDTTPAWIPRQNAFVFSAYWSYAGPSPSLDSEKTGGGSVRQLVSHCKCTHPEVSPNGLTVLYDKGPALWTTGIGGGTPTIVAAHGSHGSWSPNGKQIAFVSGGSVYVADPTGGGRRRLASKAFDPVWSPNGRLIAYAVNVKTQGLKTEIFTRPSMGGKAHLLYAEKLRSASSRFGGMDWQAIVP
jgi:Tol biopolymer transport system component